MLVEVILLWFWHVGTKFNPLLTDQLYSLLTQNLCVFFKLVMLLILIGGVTWLRGWTLVMWQDKLIHWRKVMATFVSVQRAGVAIDVNSFSALWLNQLESWSRTLTLFQRLLLVYFNVRAFVPTTNPINSIWKQLVAPKDRPSHQHGT